MELTEIGHPVIARLRDRTRCSAHLVVRDGREVVFIAKAPGESALFQSVQVGARLPAHATVLGRLLLSDLSTLELERLYPESTLQRFTEHTPRTLTELTRLIAADRKRGWAISEGGFETGISTIAAPVVAGRGHVTADSPALSSTKNGRKRLPNRCKKRRQRLPPVLRIQRLEAHHDIPFKRRAGRHPVHHDRLGGHRTGAPRSPSRRPACATGLRGRSSRAGRGSAQRPRSLGGCAERGPRALQAADRVCRSLRALRPCRACACTRHRMRGAFDRCTS